MGIEMRRVLLKLSGEALAGDKKTGFDDETIRGVALQVKQLVEEGIQVGVVIGGGNFWRGRSSESIDRTKADQIGMLATIMNCIYVSEIFRSVGMMTSVLTPFECGSFTKLFSKDRANKYFGKNMVVFFAGGTGHPYFSTDTGVVLRAVEVLTGLPVREDVAGRYPLRVQRHPLPVLILVGAGHSHISVDPHELPPLPHGTLSAPGAPLFDPSETFTYITSF